MANREELTQESVQDRFTGSFRINAYLRFGPFGYLSRLSKRTGIPLSTLKSYQESRATPQLKNLLLLFSALPDEFANGILSSINRHIVNISRTDTLTNTLVLNKTLASLLKVVADALEDEVVDHQETLAMEPLVRETLAACNDWLAGLKKPVRVRRE